MRSTLLGRLGSCRNASCLKNRSDSGRARLNRTSTPCIATRTFTTATRSSDTNSSQQEGSGDHLAFDTVCELASSTLRYGAGATSEVGADLAQQFRARQVVLFTDANVRDLACMNVVLESLERHGISHVAVYDQVRVEPNDGSFRHAIQFLQSLEYDAVVALGGGSVIDTAKAANLFACHDDVDLYDFVNAPIGRGLPVPALNSKGKAIKPLIAIPTTAGTGSETTGVAIFDDTATHSKTGIASRQIRPALGIVDPDNTATLPPKVATYSGLDVLCHAMESYTALPYTKRIKPTSPQVRPAYQGSNPIADVWSLFALKTCAANLVAAVHPHDNNSNAEARSQMLLASSAAGMGFGNAGVHLCHGMSYPISSQVRDFRGVRQACNGPSFGPARIERDCFGAGRLLVHGRGGPRTARNVRSDLGRSAAAAKTRGLRIGRVGLVRGCRVVAGRRDPDAVRRAERQGRIEAPWVHGGRHPVAGAGHAPAAPRHQDQPPTTHRRKGARVPLPTSDERSMKAIHVHSEHVPSAIDDWTCTRCHRVLLGMGGDVNQHSLVRNNCSNLTRGELG
jgi:alcohol dehydrogenase class IV